MNSGDKATVWAIAAVVGLLVVAHTVITVLGGDSEGLVRLVTVLAGIGGVGVYNGRQLHQIKRQTNGVLDGRIREQADHVVRQALAEAGYDINVPAPPTKGDV